MKDQDHHFWEDEDTARFKDIWEDEEERQTEDHPNEYDPDPNISCGKMNDKPMKDQLQNIEHLVERLNELKKSSGILEEELKRLKSAADKFETELLPDALDQAGIASIVLSNGTKIEIANVVFAKIPEKHTTEAIQWLHDKGHGGIIKDTLTVMPDNTNYADFIQRLEAEGTPFRHTHGIHHQTLKKFVKERIEEEDKEFPRRLFGVFEKRVAQVK